MKMKKLMVFALVMVVLGTAFQVGAVPTVPPIPNPPTPPPTPPETPPPSPGGGGTVLPIIEGQQKFEVISIEPVMEGYAGGSVDFDLKVIQKGYPDLVVHLTAEVPDKWKASFSKNDFDLKTDETMELVLSLSPPENVSTDKYEIKIEGTGKAKEDSVEVKDSVIVTAMTYLVDVGVVNFQFSPVQPRVGENVTVTVTAVNYTQRIIDDVVVEFLVNNGLISRQTVTLPGGASQPLTFGWTAQSGTSTFVVKAKATGDSNRRNDSVSQQVVLGSEIEQINLLFDQASALFFQENYVQARDLFATVAVQYTQIGETGSATEATRYQNLCESYIKAQDNMTQGEEAFQMEDYEQAVYNFEQAQLIYAQLGDTEKENFAKERLDAAREAQGSGINFMYLGISVIAVAVVAFVTLQISRRRGRARPVQPAAQPSRFRLEEPVSQPPVTRPVSTPPPREPSPVRAAPPAELVQFHQKTEDALSRFTKGYVRDNLQQAMRVYLSLEGEKKQLPKGRDLELERIIDTNLRELEHRIFGTF